MAETVRVQVLFTEETPVGTLSDALYYSLDEYAALADADIEAAKQARVSEHTDRVLNTPAAKEPTSEELQTEVESVQALLLDLQSKISETKSI